MRALASHLDDDDVLRYDRGRVHFRSFATRCVSSSQVTEGFDVSTNNQGIGDAGDPILRPMYLSRYVGLEHEIALVLTARARARLYAEE